MPLHFTSLEDIITPVLKGESSEIRVPGDFSRREIRELIEKLPSLPRLRVLHFRDVQMDEQTVSLLAEAVAGRDDLEEFGMDKIPLSDASALKIAAALKPHHGMKKLYFSYCAMEDKGVAALADTAAGFADLRGLYLSGNQWSQNTHDRIADALADKRNLVGFMVVPPKRHLSEAAFERAFLEHPHPNLTTLHGLCSPEIRKLSDHNTAIRAESRKTLEAIRDLSGDYDAISAVLSPARVALVHIQRPALLYHLNQGEAMLKTYDDFIDRMPKLPANAPVTSASLFAPNAQGLTPLENPLVWREHPGLVAELAANGELPGTTQRTRGGLSLIEAALAYTPAEKTLPILYDRGIRIRTKDLLDTDGKPTLLLQVLGLKGKVQSLFSKENWWGSDPEEVAATLKALPEHARQGVSIPHALSLELRMSHAGRHKGR